MIIQLAILFFFFFIYNVHNSAITRTQELDNWKKYHSKDLCNLFNFLDKQDIPNIYFNMLKNNFLNGPLRYVTKKNEIVNNHFYYFMGNEHTKLKVTDIKFLPASIDEMDKIKKDENENQNEIVSTFINIKKTKRVTSSMLEIIGSIPNVHFRLNVDMYEFKYKSISNDKPLKDNKSRSNLNENKKHNEKVTTNGLKHSRKRHLIGINIPTNAFTSLFFNIVTNIKDFTNFSKQSDNNSKLYKIFKYLKNNFKSIWDFILKNIVKLFSKSATSYRRHKENMNNKDIDVHTNINTNKHSIPNKNKDNKMNIRNMNNLIDNKAFNDIREDPIIKMNHHKKYNIYDEDEVDTNYDRYSKLSNEPRNKYKNKIKRFFTNRYGDLTSEWVTDTESGTDSDDDNNNNHDNDKEKQNEMIQDKTDLNSPNIIENKIGSVQLDINLDLYNLIVQMELKMYKFYNNKRERNDSDKIRNLNEIIAGCLGIVNENTQDLNNKKTKEEKKTSEDREKFHCYQLFDHFKIEHISFESVNVRYTPMKFTMLPQYDSNNKPKVLEKDLVYRSFKENIIGTDSFDHFINERFADAMIVTLNQIIKTKIGQFPKLGKMFLEMQARAMAENSKKL